jgi:hypothetical protein
MVQTICVSDWKGLVPIYRGTGAKRSPGKRDPLLSAGNAQNILTTLLINSINYSPIAHPN